VFLSAVFASKQIKQVGKAREVMTLFGKILWKYRHDPQIFKSQSWRL